MPLLSRKLSMLAVLVLSASLQSTLAFAQSDVGGLNGQYAFQLNGTLTEPGIASRATAAIGSFTADGQGNITSGEMDFTSAAQTFQALPITGTYTLDITGRGTLKLTSTKGTETFTFYGTDDGSAMPSYASGSLVETDAGPVVSSGSFYQQAPAAFDTAVLYGFWQTALTGDTFVTEGTPSPIFVGGALFFDGFRNQLTFTRRTGAAAPETISWALDSGFIDSSGRIVFTAYAYPLHLAAYVIDVQHILIISTDPPQVNPLLSGTIVRSLFPNP